MHLQQQAMNHFATFLNTRDQVEAEQGVSLLKQTISAQKLAYGRAKEAGLSDNSWYYSGINQFLRKEFELKISNYDSLMETPMRPESR